MTSLLKVLYAVYDRATWVEKFGYASESERHAVVTNAMNSLKRHIFCGRNERIAPSRSHGGQMKLYVWEGFCPDYTDGLAFAVAKNITQARRLIAEKMFNSSWVKEQLVATPQIFYLDTPIAFAIMGGD